MENIIKYAVECGSWYGIVALAIIAVCFIVAVVYANKIIRFVFPYLHKDLYKICNIIGFYIWDIFQINAILKHKIHIRYIFGI